MDQSARGEGVVPASWEELFAVLDEAAFPEDFLADRGQGIEEERGPQLRGSSSLDTGKGVKPTFE